VCGVPPPKIFAQAWFFLKLTPKNSRQAEPGRRRRDEHRRKRASANLLSSGKVLVAGGEDGSSLMPTTFSSAENYDPVAGTWAPTSTMNSRRSRFTAARLANGNVIAASGADNAFLPFPAHRTENG
jgi:hypothetical protein